MKAIAKNKIIALAICITNIACFAQQNKSGFCRLGEINDEGLFPAVDSLIIDCSTTDPIKFEDYCGEFNSLKCVIIQGDASDDGWKNLFTS